MANSKKRNRQSSGSTGASACAKMHVCKESHCGGTRCAKNKCSGFADPKNPKNKKYMDQKKASK